MNNYLHAKLRVLSILSTLFVVFVHSHNLLLIMSESEILARGGMNAFIENFLSQGIARVASPLFFLISGYLLFLNMKETSGWFIAKVKKRARTLLMPYLIWSLWGILFFLILQQLPFTRSFFTSELIADYSFLKLLKTFFIDPIPYQLWFIRDLLGLIVVSPLIYYLVKHFNWYVLTAFLLLWFFEIMLYVFDTRSLFFFAAGIYFAINSHLLTEKKYPSKGVLFFMLWIAFSLLKTIMVFNGVDMVIYSVIQKISVFLGLAALWCLYDKFFMDTDLTKMKIYPYFSFSFFIYVSHEPILTIMKKLLLSFLGHNDPGVLISYFAAPFITIFLAVMTGSFLKNRFHKFYYFISGGR